MEVTIKAAKNLMMKVVQSKAQQPVMLHSSPGVGKSSIVKQVCQENDWVFIDVRLSSMESSDVQGIPYVDGEDMRFSTPEWFPTDPDAKGILFFDEISNASIDVQKASYRVILDRQVQNGKTLPEGIKIIAAGNLKSDKTGAKDLVPALANRFGFHLNIKADPADFKSYASKVGIDFKVIGFIEWKPDALYRFDTARNEHSFPTPRSWEALSDLLSVGYDDDELAPVISGCVGENTSHEFMSFLRYYAKLPSMDDIANGKIEFKVDNSDRGMAFALTSSLMSVALSNINDDAKIKNIWKVVDQLEDEFIALVYRNLKHADESYLIALVKNTMQTWKRVSKRIS